MNHIYKPGYPKTEGRYFIRISGILFGLHSIFPVKHLNCWTDEEVQNAINRYNKSYNLGVTSESQIEHCEVTHQELLSLQQGNNSDEWYERNRGNYDSMGIQNNRNY